MWANLFVWQSSKLCCVAMWGMLLMSKQACMQQEVPG